MMKNNNDSDLDPKLVRLRGLNGELRKALATAQSYIDACAPLDSPNRAMVLSEIAGIMKRTERDHAELELVYDNMFHYMRTSEKLGHELYAARRNLRRLRNRIRSMSAFCDQALEEPKT